MRAKVVEDETYRNYYTSYQFLNFGINANYYEVIGTGRHIAIRDRNNNAVSNIFEIAMNTYRNVPVYKQCMQLQMGRVPKTKTVVTKVLQIRPVNTDLIGRYKYRLYNIVEYY